MKQFLTTDVGGYTFDKVAKTVTFTGGYTPTLKQILGITNATRNIVIYNPADVNKGGTLSGNVLTLTYNTNTGGFANTDELMIAVDVLGGTVFPAGFLRVSDEPVQLLYDAFDSATIDSNLWNTPTTGNSGVGGAITSGVFSMGTGTTANGWSKISSVPTFKPTVPSWIGYSFAINLPDGAAPTANAYRFWGAGNPATTPTTAAPMTDGVGFEITTAGKLAAVVYSAGVRTQIADLSSTGNNTQPLNANYNRYIVVIRTDKTYWYINNLKTVVAESNFQAPSVQILPACMLAVGGATPPASNTQILCSGLAVWDTGKNSSQLSDGTYPFRKAQVGKYGGLSIKGESLPALTQNVTANTPVTTSALDASEAGNVTFIVKNTAAATGYTGNPVIAFEQSDDGTSWAPLTVVRSDNNVAATTHYLTPNSAFAELMFDGAAEGVNWVRARVITAQSANGMTIVIQPGGLGFSPVVSTINGAARATYRAATAALLTTATTLGIPFFIIQGSASKIVKLQRIIISGISLTAVAYININLAKYSTAPTGGTATVLAKVPLDSSYPAATANLVQVYTAVPTAGTKVGDISVRRNMGQATTATAAGVPEEIIFDLRSSGAESAAPVLRGIAEGFGVYWQTAPASAPSLQLTVEWTEE